jgi:PAS domain S-box-containing protein
MKEDALAAIDGHPMQSSFAFVSPLNRLWQRLTTPHDDVQDSEQRRQAHLLASLLVLQIALSAPVVVLRLLTDPTNSTTYWLLALAIALLLPAYALSRTPRYRFGGVWYVGDILVFVVIVTKTSPNVNIDRALDFLALVALLSSLLLPLRPTIVVTLIAVTTGVLLHLFSPPASATTLLPPLSFVILMSCLTLLAAAVRHSDQHQIRQQAQILAESEEYHRTLFESVFEAILLHDAGVIVDVNRAFETMFGYDKAESIGKSVYDLLVAENRAEIEACLQNDPSTPFEVIGKKKDGTRFEIECIHKRHLYRGRSLNVVTFRDMTERKRIERQRLELAIERERVAVLQRFISDAAHDLRTPLANIKTSLYLIKRLSDDPEKQQQHLEGIELQATKLERLFNDLLMLSKLDKAATAEFKFGLLDLNALVREIIARQKDFIEMKRHEVTFTPADNLPLVWADKLRIAQAIGNLLTNAINYTPEHGKIALRTYSHKAHVIVEVSDNGIGIEEKDLPHIFESFYRADQARDANTGGVGLGLSIVKRIAEAHRASIEVESTPSVGSTFRLVMRGNHH